MSWRDEARALPNFAPTTFEVDPTRTGLIVVDMQYVDAHRDYGLGSMLRKEFPNVWRYYFDRVETVVIPGVRRLLELFREHELKVVHLTIGPVLADGGDMVKTRRPKAAAGLKPMLYEAGSFEHQILEDVAPMAGELIINKTSRGAFNSTAIERVLLNLDLETLVFAGVSTSSCVETSARDAADRGFQVVIVEDASAELDRPSHEATLRQFAVRWGRVWTVEEVVGEVERAVSHSPALETA